MPDNMVSAEKVRIRDIPAKSNRVCLDPRELNEALVREPYYTWSADELTTKFHSVEYFRIVNMKKGFWQVELHPYSQMYTAMSLPSGRYVWTRLLMGLVVSSDKLQKKLDTVYNAQPGVTGIVDDMIITGKSQEEHDHNFLNFLQITRSNHLRLNGEKVQFKLKEVSLFGHRWCRDGLDPDPKKIKPTL